MLSELKRSWFILFICVALIGFYGCSDSDGDTTGGSENDQSGDSSGDKNPPDDPDHSDGSGDGNSSENKLPAVGGACGDITNSGKCYGNIVYYCDEQQVLQSYNCEQNQQICGMLSDDTHTWYACTDKTDGGDHGNTPGDLVTAEDWARALIAGSVSTADAFEAISQGTGFPVVTDDNTVIFIHWYEGGDWKVAGDFNDWGKNGLTQMTNIRDFWYAEVDMPDNPVENNYYKFVNGNTYEADHWSQRYTYTEDGEISYIVTPDKPYLMRWPGFKSPQGLASRTVRAYVPTGQGPFDIIYAHDGQNLFGPGGAYGSWNVESNMEKAEASFIVVGIDNGEAARLSEYAFVDEDLSSMGYGYVEAKGNDYAKFVHETVRPFMEKRFHLTGKVGLMGSSMGGLISLYIAHLYPTDYDVVLALSPTTAWGRFSHADGQVIEDIYAAAGHRQFTLYLDNGGNAPEGGCSEVLTQADAANDENNLDCYCFTHSFVEKMAEIGYTWNVDLFHHDQPGAPHNEQAWADRLVKPLTIFKNNTK